MLSETSSEGAPTTAVSPSMATEWPKKSSTAGSGAVSFRSSLRAASRPASTGDVPWGAGAVVSGAP